MVYIGGFLFVFAINMGIIFYQSLHEYQVNQRRKKKKEQKKQILSRVKKFDTKRRNELLKMMNIKPENLS